MFLKDPDAIPPVLAIEVKSKAIPHARGPRIIEKEEGALLCQKQEAHIIDLRVEFCLTEW